MNTEKPTGCPSASNFVFSFLGTLFHLHYNIFTLILSIPLFPFYTCRECASWGCVHVHTLRGVCTHTYPCQPPVILIAQYVQGMKQRTIGHVHICCTPAHPVHISERQIEYTAPIKPSRYLQPRSDAACTYLHTPCTYWSVQHAV